MARAKKAPATEVEEPVVPEEAEETPELVVAEGTEVPEAPPGVARKAMGTKEIIPFAWKLIGRSGDLMVTLFKAVERDDVQAQFDRLTAEGYYRDLQIVDVNFKIDQPKQIKAATPKTKAAAPPKEKSEGRSSSRSEHKAPTVIKVTSLKTPKTKPEKSGKGGKGKASSSSKSPVATSSKKKTASKVASKPVAKKSAKKK